jgi:4-amino-4-deoxy-L-arabinose transferase-like glycosyltransferase
MYEIEQDQTVFTLLCGEIEGIIKGIVDGFLFLCTMNQLRWSLFREPWFYLIFGWVIVLFRGLFLDVMDVDASQYASISMEMMQQDNWLEVQHRGADYLDKPPLLFWLSAAFFKVFGLSNWAYKLPSVLFAIAGIGALYKFSRLFYAEETARFAAVILASSVGMLLLCNDVRTDTLLLGTTTCAIWQLAEYQEKKQWKNLIFAFILIGLAMLAKGPIGIVMPAFAIGSHLLLCRDFKSIFSWKWLLGLCITLILLLPMCWGLYQQYDLHPEKHINGRTGVSGLYFFFWEQSFGRITGENVWKNDTSALFFVHTYLWAFLPWSILLLGALSSAGNRLWRNWFRLAPGAEGYALGGFLLCFVALSLSKYKLPHYIFITLPWASILTADYVARLKGQALKRWMICQYILIFLVVLIAFLIIFYVFPENNWGIAGLISISTVLLACEIRYHRGALLARHLVQRSTAGILIAALALNFHFYPELLRWQSTAVLIKQAKELSIPPQNIAFFRRHGHALDFYNQHLLTYIADIGQLRETLKQSPNLWIYTTQAGKDELEAAGFSTEIAIKGQHFQVALLKLSFLSPSTRPKTTESVFLLRVF